MQLAERKAGRRSRWGRLPRRVRVVTVSVIALAFLAWAVPSEITAQKRLVPLRAARAALTDAKVQEWKQSEPCAEPLAGLLKSLSWWQMWRLAHSKDWQLPFSTLTAPQRRLFWEVLRIKDSKSLARMHRNDPAAWDKADVQPAYLFVGPAGSDSGNAAVANVWYILPPPYLLLTKGRLIEIPR